ncbi:MAG: peptidoglycan-binding protein, partial [Firmicutes bacterium]|nr:peptidoglycan-binding protein [Bacillota bacterium]
YIPYPSDYIWFYYYSRAQGTDHVALIEGVSRDADGSIQVHVIEGNNPDKVQRAVYALEDKSIYGYGTPVKRAYTNLRVYLENDDVLLLQTELAALGYYTMESRYTGVFSSKLKDAVKQLQRDTGVRATGIVDMDTRAAIDALLDSAMPAGEE